MWYGVVFCGVVCCGVVCCGVVWCTPPAGLPPPLCPLLHVSPPPPRSTDEDKTPDSVLEHHRFAAQLKRVRQNNRDWVHRVNSLLPLMKVEELAKTAAFATFARLEVDIE